MKMVVSLACAAFLVLQIAPAPYRLDLPTHRPALSFDADQHVPAPVKIVVRRACLDCHSHLTRVPWYGRAAPASWLLAHDVSAARQAMNLSEWLAQTPPYRLALASAACQDARSGRMPKPRYVLFHPEARLSPQDVEDLCSWPRAVLAGIKLHRAARGD